MRLFTLLLGVALMTEALGGRAIGDRPHEDVVAEQLERLIGVR